MMWPFLISGRLDQSSQVIQTDAPIDRVCMYEICFYSCLLSYYMLINVDYTITYFLPIPSTVPRTRARSELLNVSLVPPRVEFYTALPVSIVGRY